MGDQYRGVSHTHIDTHAHTHTHRHTSTHTHIQTHKHTSTYSDAGPYTRTHTVLCAIHSHTNSQSSEAFCFYCFHLYSFTCFLPLLPLSISSAFSLSLSQPLSAYSPLSHVPCFQNMVELLKGTHLHTHRYPLHQYGPLGHTHLLCFRHAHTGI